MWKSTSKIRTRDQVSADDWAVVARACAQFMAVIMDVKTQDERVFALRKLVMVAWRYARNQSGAD